MVRYEDLSGKRFGRLVAMEHVDTGIKKKAYWKCQCDCGNTVVVLSSSLKRGNTRSCGCLRKEILQSMYKGVKRHPLYNHYHKIKARCYRENTPGYQYYGGRGIKMSEEWRNSFLVFAEYVGKLPHCMESGYSIDRIDVNGNYEPGNIRWATAVEQGRNKRNNIKISAFGQTMTLVEWAEECGIKYGTLYNRIVLCGIDAETAMRLPTRSGKRLRSCEDV